MKIKSIEIGILNSPLKTPFITAVRRVDSLTDVIVKIEADNGLTGWGGAAPTAKVTGETLCSIAGAVNEAIKPALIGTDCDDLEGSLDIIDQALMHNTSAKAAVDIALHDLWAKSIGQPAWKLFGGSGRSISTDITISLNEPEEMAKDALRAVADGFTVLKLKVGGDTATDMKRLSAIKEATGGQVRFRLDANQGWAPTDAVKIIGDMASDGLNIDLVEQPVKSYDLAGLKFVTDRSPFPIVADESCQNVKDAINIISGHYADMVNIKLMKCGGVRGARQILDMAKAFDVKVMIGCMMEGKVSVSAAAHLASAYSCVAAVDLDSPNLCASYAVQGGPDFSSSSEIKMNNNLGFGITEVPDYVFKEPDQHLCWAGK